MSSKRKCVHKTNKMLFHYNKSHQCRAIDAPLMIKSSQKDARTKITNRARQKKPRNKQTDQEQFFTSSSLTQREGHFLTFLGGGCMAQHGHEDSASPK